MLVPIGTIGVISAWSMCRVDYTGTGGVLRTQGCNKREGRTLPKRAAAKAIHRERLTPDDADNSPHWLDDSQQENHHYGDGLSGGPLSGVAVDDVDALAFGKSGNHALFVQGQEPPKANEGSLLADLDGLAVIWSAVREKIGGSDS